ncbi:MAG: cobyrinate a,c-diamide synthase [Muribaculaceae bacterium]|nr:cobyrinate a,c-diamide synthase [Muribaculaceae bacterium]
MIMKNAFLIAGVSSGSGKTTLSLGLMRALKRRGLTVQPFKCGPDYIDTQYHCQATGNKSINLDLFMASEEHIKELFSRFGSQTDVSVVEGVMGMFDGYDKLSGSSADIALRLSLPVILLVNAASTAFSVAATIYGFTRFREDINVVGVVFNRVASENHYTFLCDACRATGVPALGYMSRNEMLKTPSRHLGLSLDSRIEMESFIEAAADEVDKHVDIESLLSLTKVDLTVPEIRENVKEVPGRVVAVACDEAFNFTYPVNLETLRSRIVYFSPLYDKSLPNADMVYLPGGYPELYASELEANFSMRKAIKDFAEEGGKILAECGGMIYLTEDIDGRKMCGVLPLQVTMEAARLTLGYRRIVFPESALTLKGHEFHYSHIKEEKNIKEEKTPPSISCQFNVKGGNVATPFYRYKNTIAGYTHLYWAETDIFKLWKQ